MYINPSFSWVSSRFFCYSHSLSDRGPNIRWSRRKSINFYSPRPCPQPRWEDHLPGRLNFFRTGDCCAWYVGKRREWGMGWLWIKLWIILEHSLLSTSKVEGLKQSRYSVNGNWMQSSPTILSGWWMDFLDISGSHKLERPQQENRGADCTLRFLRTCLEAMISTYLDKLFFFLICWSFTHCWYGGKSLKKRKEKSTQKRKHILNKFKGDRTSSTESPWPT